MKWFPIHVIRIMWYDQSSNISGKNNYESNLKFVIRDSVNTIDQLNFKIKHSLMSSYFPIRKTFIPINKIKPLNYRTYKKCAWEVKRNRREKVKKKFSVLLCTLFCTFSFQNYFRYAIYNFKRLFVDWRNIQNKICITCVIFYAIFLVFSPLNLTK
jgi:hypothetical protein